jgi:hypothetical protein
MKRKKFFAKFSFAVLGLSLIKFNPVKLFKEKSVVSSNPVMVKENKLAVKREKPGVKNV